MHLNTEDVPKKLGETDARIAIAQAGVLLARAKHYLDQLSPAQQKAIEMVAYEDEGTECHLILTLNKALSQLDVLQSIIDKPGANWPR